VPSLKLSLVAKEPQPLGLELQGGVRIHIHAFPNHAFDKPIAGKGRVDLIYLGYINPNIEKFLTPRK